MDDVRRRGAVGILIPLLAISAAGRAWLGDHAGAFADAGEAAELSDHLDYVADAVRGRRDARLAARRPRGARRGATSRSPAPGRSSTERAHRRRGPPRA